MGNKIFYIVVALVLVALLVLLSDLFVYYMPEGLQMIALLSVAVLASVWAGVVMYEKANDEREVTHKMQAGRAAYISGILVLTLALIFQGLNHDIDPWISLSLGVMVVSRIIARLYYEKYK